jgi:hypothetical protein
MGIWNVFLYDERVLKEKEKKIQYIYTEKRAYIKTGKIRIQNQAGSRMI